MIPTPNNSNRLLAQTLQRQQMLPQSVIDALLARSETLAEWLGHVIVEENLLSYNEIAQALASDMKVPLIDLNTATPDIQGISLLPADTCRSYQLFPLAFNDSTLTLAMTDPLNESVLQTIRGLVSAKTVSYVVAAFPDIMAAINKWYGKLAPEPPRQDETIVTQLFAQIQSTPPPAPQMDMLSSDMIDQDDISIDQLLFAMLEHKASDLHLAVGSPPMMRVDGELLPMDFPKLTPHTVQTMIYAVLNDIQITQFEQHWELDFAYSIPRVSRFRVNVLRQRGSMGAVLRTIPEDLPTLDSLRMPAVVRELTQRPRGLVLVTGPTGSGKSTTLAAMINEINQTRRGHIVTIEDPIEFLHRNKMCVVTQREIGSDTETFTAALRHVLRQDPDVILIGEMRDLETIAAAVTAAETGHLVLATLHTTTAAQTIERIIDVFPPHQQEQIRSQLSNTLEGILTQTLLPKIDGKGRACAQEILTCTPAVRNLIREGKVHQMASVMQASSKYGMQTLDQALKDLVMARKVSLESAIQKASNPDDFKALVAMQ